MTTTRATGLAAIPPLDRSRLPGDLAGGVYATLEHAILRGTLRPGDRLNADALAKQLGISHIPVREALRALAVARWIEFRPHQGAFVTTRTAQELSDLYEMRLCVEPFSARVGAERRTAEQLATLTALLDEQCAAPDPITFAEINARFHTAVAACTHNAHLARCIGELNARTRFYFAPAADARHDKSIADHIEIVRAISDRRAEDAERIARRHIEESRAEVHTELRLRRQVEPLPSE